ncbi:DsbA family protein [Corynebacterium singulare]|uniref:Thioredoxin domain-containing protein n=1 Tax=Corynebacterium singulare TaxID=161899 RepID=A0ABS9PU76_9CORY|nr:thioredoxin domain-containing protein [Corynebacterium singulare]MCG7276271.1 thioredoxin domain-containing protein [Corynebacterium singulare]
MPNQSSRPTSGPKKSVLSTISPVAWGLLVLVVILAVTIGFLLADRASSNTEGNAAAGEASSTATQSPTASQDLAKDADKATPGTKFSDGTGDPMMFGPGGDTMSGDITVVHRRKDNDPFAVGAVDAPVVISEFSDFECPFCSRHANVTEPTLQHYVDKGLVRIEWNDYPVNGPAAVEAAKAGRAAAAQGKFAEFKHELYSASKDISGHPEFGIEDFMKFAQKAGVKDLKKFRQEATDDTYSEVIETATSYASQIGISGTPAFVVGDQFIGGAQPAEAFDQVIQEQLGKAANA